MTLALVSPLAGICLDRWRAVRTASMAFAVLTLYPFCLFFAYIAHSTLFVYLGFAVAGVGMAGMNSAWNLGVLEFARETDASVFMGVHVTAAGVRGLAVPVIGYALTALFNLGVVYLTASAFFLSAALLMSRLKPKPSGAA